MTRNTEQFFDDPYDLLIVGGGINGAGIANLASAAGLSVALIEKGDFASGTSSKSTKLIHGGIRYLEHFEFDLVREALKERFIQMKTAPHLVKRIPFVIPVYKGGPRPLWVVRAGAALYDFLSGRYRIGRHRALTAKDIQALEPQLAAQNLQGGVLYYDAQMDDARLCLENILQAKAHGAYVSNYTEAVSFLYEGEHVVGVNARDCFLKEIFTIKAKRVVCAVGPWSNFVLRKLPGPPKTKKVLRTTKGIHIVYRGQLVNHALVFTKKEDKRIFFAIPWQGHTLIGTTDTNFIRRPEDAKATHQDVQYLLQEIQKYFPHEDFSRDQIITTFAGLRPLIRRGGSPGSVSRRHKIMKTPSGVTFVLGGKYTTYRKIAEDCLKKLGVKSSVPFRVYGSGEIKEETAAMAQEYSIDKETVEHLQSVYGSRFRDVLDLTLDNAALKHRICPCSPAIAAQVAYAKNVETAQTPDDILSRRLGLVYRGCSTKSCEEFIRKSFH